MHPPEITEPGAALTVALALAVGMVAQSVARHLKLPDIVLLLAAGVLLARRARERGEDQIAGPGV